LTGLSLSSSGLRKVLFLAMSQLASEGPEGPAAVLQMFKEAKSLQLKDHVEEEERRDDKMAEVLSSHKLSFLMPMLSIRQDMKAHLEAESGSPDSLLKWIQGNVGADLLTQPDFVVTLMSVVLNHINSVSAGTAENEKDRLAAFRTLLRTFIGPDDKRLQLTAVYALQVWAHSQGFPNGVLLRSFVNCYELDIIDEHAFLSWKEDVNDFYPEKGKALFQVNKWLNWLEEAESDSEEDDE